MKNFIVIIFLSICIISLCVMIRSNLAFAWEFTPSCGPNVSPCEGKTPLPTAWRKPCIGFHVNEQGTEQIPFEEVRNTVIKSAAVWSAPNCSYFSLYFSTNEDRIGFNPYTKENANIIVFRDSSWEESKSIMALTTVTQDSVTGEIYDADIEVNTQSYSFSTVSGGSYQSVDFENTLTHEIGHVLGLAHSKVMEATMFAFSSAGGVAKRSLHSDDIEGICTLYPNTNAFTYGACKQSKFYFTRPKLGMNERPEDDCSCRTLSNAAHLPKPLSLILLIISSLFFIHRRKHIKGSC